MRAPCRPWLLGNSESGALKRAKEHRGPENVTCVLVRSTHGFWFARGDVTHWAAQATVWCLGTERDTEYGGSPRRAREVHGGVTEKFRWEDLDASGDWGRNDVSSVRALLLGGLGPCTREIVRTPKLSP